MVKGIQGKLAPDRWAQPRRAAPRPIPCHYDKPTVENRTPPRPLWERAVSLGKPQASLAKRGEGCPAVRWAGPMADAGRAREGTPWSCRRGRLRAGPRQSISWAHLSWISETDLLDSKSGKSDLPHKEGGAALPFRSRERTARAERYERRSAVHGVIGRPTRCPPSDRAASPVIGYRPRRPVKSLHFGLADGIGLFSGSFSLAQSEDPRDGNRVRLDQASMAAVAAGDRDAFGAIVAAQTPRLLRFARTLLTASPAEAEEVVQEALLRLWQQAPTWQPNGRISTWLHQVTYRLCIDRIRRARPAVAIDFLVDGIEDEDTPRPDARLVRIDDVRAIRAAIAALPERQRTAILLAHFQELGQADAATVMGLGESAYELLLARARRRLKSLLAAGGDTGGAS